MNLNQLKAFCVLARTLHFSRAAAELEIAQPSLSRIIAQLEQELGAPLFMRQGRSILLTQQGALFYRHINKGLAEIDRGQQAVRDMMLPGHGIIDFAFIYALSPTYIPQVIQKYYKDPTHKNIQFRFYQLNSTYIVQKLKEGSCDMGLCSFLENEPLIQFRPIAKQEYVLMVSNQHPLAQKDSVTLEEAAQYDFILPLDKTSYVEQLLEKADLRPHVTSRVEEDHAAAALVSINLGIAIIPKNKMLKQYNVKLLPFAPEPLYRTFYLAKLWDKQFSPAAENFYRFLAQESKGSLPVF